MREITFRSSRFSTIPKEDAINDVVGRDLAEWMRTALAGRGFDVGEVIAEDYGYGFWLQLHGSHYWIAHGLDGDSGDDSQPAWRIVIGYDPGCLWVWRLRARPRPNDEQTIMNEVCAILEAEADIHAVE